MTGKAPELMTVNEMRAALQNLGVANPFGGKPVLLDRLKTLLNDLGVSTVDEALQMGGKPASTGAGSKKRPRDAEADDAPSRKKPTAASGLFPPSSTPTGSTASAAGLASENASLRREVTHLRSENDQLRQQLSQQVGSANAASVDLLMKQTERSLEQTQRLFDQLSAHKQSLEDLT